MKKFLKWFVTILLVVSSSMTIWSTVQSKVEDKTEDTKTEITTETEDTVE